MFWLLACYIAGISIVLLRQYVLSMFAPSRISLLRLGSEAN